jgi:NAD(P)-dependent dehydrogenase (short-subunit alcohol dehydrogenase family)
VKKLLITTLIFFIFPLSFNQEEKLGNSVNRQPADDKSKSVVVVTGSASGLGLEIAKKYLVEGYSVVIVARSAPPKDMLNHSNVMYVNMDLEKSSSVHNLVDAVIGRWGKIDILINNSAATVLESTLVTSNTNINRTINVNYIGPAELSSYALQEMEKLRLGIKIIYLSSAAAISPRAEFARYGAAKAAAEMHFLTMKDEIEKLRKQGELIGKHDISIIRPAFIKSDYNPGIVGEGKETMEVAKALRNLSPTRSQDVVNAIFEISNAAKMPAIKNVGADGITIQLMHNFLPRSVTKIIQSSAEGLAVSISNSKTCTSAMDKFVLPSVRALYKKRNLLLGASALFAFMIGYNYNEVENAMSFFYDFMSKMKERANLITQSPTTVENIIDRAGFFLEYKAPSINLKCDGVFHGRFIMSGGMESFMEHWDHALSIRMGSMHDRLYADLVHDLYEKIKGNPILKMVPLKADDVFYIRMEDGVMTEMQEDIKVYQLGIEVSSSTRIYNKVVAPRMINSIEQAVLANNCDAKKIEQFYRQLYDPRKLSKGANLDIDFTLTSLVPNDSVPYLPMDREYYHTFEFLAR